MIQIIGLITFLLVDFMRFRDMEQFVRHTTIMSVDFARVNVQSVSVGDSYSSTAGLTKQKLLAYCDSLEQQALSSGTAYDGSWLQKAITSMRETAGTSTALTPLNFGLTYIDPSTFENLVRTYMRDMIRYNYGDETHESSIGSARGLLQLDTFDDSQFKVNVYGPKLAVVNVDDPFTQSIFGNTDYLRGSNGLYGNFSFYVWYDIEVSYKYGTVATLAKLPIWPERYNGSIEALNGKAIIRMPQKATIWMNYSLTN